MVAFSDLQQTRHEEHLVNGDDLQDFVQITAYFTNKNV